MSPQPISKSRLGATMLLLALFFGAVLTASVAIAGVPSNQGKGQLPPKQPEHPSKGTEKPAPPNAINTRGGVQSSVQVPFGGGACGPGSIQFDAEPNDTITNSQMLSDTFDSEIRGNIDYASDVDYFSFTANAGDRIWAYAFTLGAVSSTDSQLQLLNAMSQTVQHDDDNGSQADLSSAIAGAVITQTATYYLRINALSSTSTIFNYTLFIDRTSSASVPEIEPNDTFTQTNPYVMDSVVSGTIPITTDMDVYEFEYNDDNRYIFQVDGDPERDGTEFNPNFDLMNTSGAVLVTVDSDSQFDAREINSENAAFYIDTAGPPTSTLLIRVRADGNVTGTYSLHIFEVGETVCGNTPTPTNTPTSTPVCNTFVTEVEPNSTITNSQMLPTLNNLEVRASINPVGDIDYWNGNATAGQKVWAYVYTAQSNSGADSELHLLDALSNTIQHDDDNGSQTATSSGIAGAPITQSGTIHFRVNEFNYDGTITPYLLFIDLTSSTPNVTEVEPNDVYTQANMVTVGDLITGSIPISTDLDVYGFTVNAGDRIIFQADGDPERDGVFYNPNFQILDSTGAQLEAVDSDSTLGDRRSENHAFTFGSAGTYYVRMSTDVTGPLDGSYNLHLWRTGTPPCGSPTSTTTSTSTSIPTFTATATATGTATAVPPTSTQTSTTAPTSTGTVVPATSTNTSVAATNTSTAVATSTVVGATITAVATATACTINFPDNQPGNTFYIYIRCLACRGIVTGYPDGRFHAERNITRGQISKMVSNAAGFNEDPGPQIYEDVPPGSTYYAYINRLTNRGIMSGYPCPERPEGDDCDPDNPVIFLPNANATRGQLSKIVSNAKGFNEEVSGQFYADVPPTGEGSQFYEWIMRLTNRGVMSGYPCDGPGEPCDAQNRPYFRWAVEVTRGQASKIVANTFFPNCVP
ncbi:MAG: S-layer homology domain-containing protein [Chloroflexota bacterium]|nr:S-layer homology domain-containing protein [Chloroflexota bacterium]MDQ5866526.1 S-layer homology domain-containing protein [Chloroflexota bacterium]